MGQRHQIYGVFKFTDLSGKETVTRVALHHQWLYGRQALHLLANVLEFDKKAKRHSPFRDGMDNELEALTALYSMDAKGGYFHTVHDLNGSVNPLHGDNNDGITIIDFTEKEPRYCFMSLPDNGHGDRLEKMVPLSAADYIRAYYFEGCYFYEKCPDAIKKIEKEIERLLKRLQPYNVMTLSKVKELFPAMFLKAKMEVVS